MLEGLGWKIYRIWSTDWFSDAEAETKKLIAYIQSHVDDTGDEPRQECINLFASMTESQPS